MVGTPLSEIGVTKQKANQFAYRDIYTCEDLVRYFPTRYDDFSHVTGILPEDQVSVIEGMAISIEKIPARMQMFKVVIQTDNSEIVYAVWFQQNYRYPVYYNMIGHRVLVAGRVTWNDYWKAKTIKNVLLFTDDIAGAKHMLPTYKKIPGMSTEYLTEHIDAALRELKHQPDNLPDYIIDQYHLPGMMESIRCRHDPSSAEELNRSCKRTRFEDMTYFALRMLLNEENQVHHSPYPITKVELARQYIRNLPYKLTPDQKHILSAIFNHVSTGNRLNGLLQGDVGAGKTVVAFNILVMAAENGYQAALMAPTRQLAAQHYQDMVSQLKPLGLNVAFLDASAPTAQRREVIRGLKDGSVQIVVGTHTLFSKGVEFKQLACIIIDEQHKFGVLQRKALMEKAGLGVHTLMMSATPIPRSLAQSVYGTGLEVYNIHSMPSGRLPVKTLYFADDERIISFIRYQIKTGHQTYIVCPAIEDSKSEKMRDVINVDDTAHWLRTKLPEVSFGVLTSKTSQEDAETLLDDFKAMRKQVLVATSIVEVGINIPSATGMVIMSAERFGLASLHQLRGRVCRGNAQGYCIVHGDNLDNNTRIQVFLSTTDGFKIAQEDLNNRGSGNLIGIQQSGEDKYVAQMLAYPDEFKQAQKAANEIYSKRTACGIYIKAVEDSILHPTETNKTRYAPTPTSA